MRVYRERKQRRQAGADDGFTMIEMMVVVGILGMVLAMALGMTITIARHMGVNGIRIDQSQQAKVAADSMTKSLRTAVLPKQLSATCTGCDVSAFLSGDVRSVQFYANLTNDYTLVLAPSTITTNGPSKISYSVASTGVLTETIRRPNPHRADDFDYQYTCTAGSGGCLVTTRDIARRVSTTQQLFTYYDRNGVVLAPPLTGDELASVDSVDITLKVQESPSTPGVDIVTRVTLPNAGVLPEVPTSP